MSTFRVKLNNTQQGLLDFNPSTASPSGVRGQIDETGEQSNPSVQRGVYVTGPNQTNRLLRDGEVFDDCNYWKRFAYPQVPLEEAFIEVVTDDGSVYSDIPEENVFPRTFELAVPINGSFGDNQIDILGETGSFATFAQISVAGDDVRIRMNGSNDAIFPLTDGTTQVFNQGEINLSLLEVEGGASSVATVNVITSIRSACNS